MIMAARPEDHVDLQKEISIALGQVRAEYAEENDIFRMFSQPVYWGKLLGVRPCFLVGGRGTGKTTALRGLTYQGQYALNGDDIDKWVAVSAYMRVESNVVSAFKGRRLEADEWDAIFGHFINLQLSIRVLAFIEWRSDVLGQETVLDPNEMELFCVSFGIDAATPLSGLRQRLRLLSAQLESNLNSSRENLLSMGKSVLGQPVGYLTQALQADTQFAGKSFFFCIDEFENFSPSQQRVFNTLIKHVGDRFFSFKIGVRDVAGRERSTLAPNQTLSEPADFETVDIATHLKEQDFPEFASRVCADRISHLVDVAPHSMENLFPGLSTESEAQLLGIEQVNRATRAALVKAGAIESELGVFDALSDLEKGMVAFWSESQGTHLLDGLRDVIAEPGKWSTRTNNYSYAMLFSLKRRVRGRRKYYAGWSVYMQLADGNIRFALQLVYEALMIHAASQKELGTPVSFEDQTEAASRVGQKVLRELQGLSGRGGELTSLALSFGRIFQVMAAEPHGHTPEVNQFKVKFGEPFVDQESLASLLREGVAQGCLLAFDGNKRASASGETKSPNYQLHPIFAPYFVYSHRRKRDMTVRGSDVLGLARENPSAVIRGLLNGRRQENGDLPQQLSIYGDFFDEN